MVQKLEAQNIHFAVRQPLAKNFTINQGMPSNEVYRTLQDNKGFMWFCTDRGLVRFSGLEYELFDKLSGLPSNVVLDGKKDNNGKLWFISLEDDIFYYQNQFNSINIVQLLAKHNLSIDKIKIRDFYNDDYDTLHILSSKPWEKTYYIKIYANEIVKIYELTDSNSSIYYRDFKNGAIISCINYAYKGTQKNAIKHSKSGLISLSFVEHNKRIDPQNQLFNVWRHTITKKENTIFYNLENVLYQISAQGKQKKLNTNFNNIIDFTLQQNFAFVATTAGLVEIDSVYGTSKTYFQTSFITSIFCDIDSNIWISSLNKGVFLVPNLPFKVLAFDKRTQQANVSFTNIGTKYYIGRQDGKLCIVNSKNGHIDTTIQITKKGTPIDGIFALNEMEVLITSTNSPIKYNIKTGQTEQLTLGTISNIYCRWNTDTIIGIRYTNGVLGMYNNNLQNLYKSLHQPEQILDFNTKSFCFWPEPQRKRLLIGTIHGIYSFIPKSKKFSQSTEFEALKTHAISSIDQINHIYAFGTKGSGIYIKTPENNFWLNKNQGLRDLNINNLLFLNDSTLFFGTNSHLGFLHICYKNPNKSHVQFYDRNNGLLGNQIKKLVIPGPNKVLVLTDRGLLGFGPNLFENRKVTPLIFNGFEIDGHKKLDNHVSVKYDQNDIKVSFSAINFLAGDNLQYAYKIESIHTDWVKTKEPTINLSGLRPGLYQVQFVVFDNNNANSNQKPYSFSIHIETPFYYTATFIIFIICLIVGGSIFLSHLVVNRIRKNAQMQTQLIELEHLALRSQMNPHFFFNTLNSIQSFIATSDKTNAYEYISKFAKLVRNFLDQTNAKNIKLIDEIDALKSYIELEQLRFNKSFSYKIVIDPEIESQMSSLYIPAMILQPIVENAILHGLRSKESAAELRISITDFAKHFEISISDNGIGRKQAHELSLKKGKIHHSLGLENIKRRIELLNRKYNIGIVLAIDNLDNTDLQYPGTKVTIKFPIHGYD